MATKPISITLDQDVVEYLDQVRENSHRSRSFVTNAMLRKIAFNDDRKMKTLMLATIPLPAQESSSSKAISVTLDKDVLLYVEQIHEQYERSRSYVINAMLRKVAFGDERKFLSIAPPSDSALGQHQKAITF